MTRKISSSVVSIASGRAEKLKLGNLEARRDWGHAKHYVDAMWRMLQTDAPVDFVVATGECHSVREFCQIAFDYVGLNYQDYVESDPVFYRLAEVEYLVGDASKARDSLGWHYDLSFTAMVQEMVQYDLDRLKSAPNSLLERAATPL